MRLSCSWAEVMDTRPKPTGSSSFLARSNRRMSSKAGGTRTIGAPSNRSARLYLKPEKWVPAIGCPPRNENPYCLAKGKTLAQTFSLVPAQSMTSVVLSSSGAKRVMCSTTASG